MQTLKTRLGMDPAAVLAAVLVLGLAPLLGMYLVGRAQLVVLGMGGLGVGLFLLWHPQFAVHLVVAGSIFNWLYVNAGFALLGAGDLALFAALPVWLLHRFARPRELRLPRYWPLLLAYAALAGASLAAGVAPSSGINPYLRQLTYIAGLFALVDLLRTPRELERVFWLLAACGLVHAVVALGTWHGQGRLGGIPNQPNVLGTMLAFCAIPTIGLFVRTRDRLRQVVLGLALGLMLLAVVLTISRGTYVALGCALLWWLRRYRRLVVIAALLAVSVAAVLSLDKGVSDRITDRWALEDKSVSQRIQVQLNALRAIEQNPLLGLGFGQFSELHRDVDVSAQAKRSAHNHYLGQLAATGIPATLLLFGFILAQFLPLWRKRGPFSVLTADEAWLVAVLQALAIYQMVSLVFRTALRQPEWTILALYCALLAMAKARQRGHHSSKAGANSGSTPGGTSSRSGAAIGS